MGEHEPSPLRRMTNCYAGDARLKISRDILRRSTLSSLPEVRARGLSAGGRAFLNRAPDAADEALLEMGLQQNVAYAGRRGLFRDVFVRIAGNQNDRRVPMSRFRRRFARSMPFMAGIL